MWLMLLLVAVLPHLTRRTCCDNHEHFNPLIAANKDPLQSNVIITPKFAGF